MILPREGCLPSQLQGKKKKKKRVVIISHTINHFQVVRILNVEKFKKGLNNCGTKKGTISVLGNKSLPGTCALFKNISHL